MGMRWYCSESHEVMQQCGETSSSLPNKQHHCLLMMIMMPHRYLNLGLIGH